MRSVHERLCRPTLLLRELGIGREVYKRIRAHQQPLRRRLDGMGHVMWMWLHRRCHLEDQRWWV